MLSARVAIQVRTDSSSSNVAGKMRLGVVVTAVLLVVGCGSPGPTATRAASAPAPVTPAPVVTTQPTPTTGPSTIPSSVAQVTPTPATSTTPTSLPEPTVTAEVPPSTRPTVRPTPTPAATPTPTRTPAPTTPPADDAPVLEGACLTFTNQPKGEFERSLLVDLSFEENSQDGVEIGISNTNGGQPAAGSAVLPGLWQVQLGVNGQRLQEGTEFVLATVDDARGTHDLLPQVEEAVGEIPDNFRPGQSIGDSCGGF